MNDVQVTITMTINTDLGLSKETLAKEVASSLIGIPLFEIVDGREVWVMHAEAKMGRKKK